MALFHFTPNLELDLKQIPSTIQIKGEIPLYAYSFTLTQLYPTVESLNAKEAYQKIFLILKRIDKLLSNLLRTRTLFQIPEVATEFEAIRVLKVLFDPMRFSVNPADIRSSANINTSDDIFRLEAPRPFPLESASHQKLLHTLTWIDTNIKVKIEHILLNYRIPPAAIQEIAEAALTIYCLMIKMREYKLARAINFNHSIFLQDRILQLIFGDALYFSEAQDLRAGLLSNKMALSLLKELGNLSYREMCILSVFMGVVWTGQPDLQRDYLSQPNKVLSKLQARLEEARKNFCIDDIDKFIGDVGKDSENIVTVILDDNGESVFDMALFQRLLQNTGNIKLVFIVNRYPISTNISIESFKSMLADDYFADLRNYLRKDRVSLCIEEQTFRSFEYSYMSNLTRNTFQRSSMAYIKGVNFFETVQPSQILRYYCFTVTGQNCITLTGCREGSGIFARIPAGKPGYVYHDANHIITLTDIMATPA